MRSFILSQCRELRMGVTREDLGALTTAVRARSSLLFVGRDVGKQERRIGLSRTDLTDAEGEVDNNGDDDDDMRRSECNSGPHSAAAVTRRPQERQ